MACGTASDVAGAERPALTEHQQEVMAKLQRTAEFMDTSWITLCGYGIGADGVIGMLVPELGDFVTAGVSLFLMYKIRRHFPEVFSEKWHVMTMNVAIDWGAGLVPLFGDIFDMGWHSNVKNVNILRQHYGLELLSEIKPEDTGEEGTATKTKNVTKNGEP